MAISEKRLNVMERDWEDTVMPWINRVDGELRAVPAEIDMVKDILFPEIRRLNRVNKKLKNELNRYKNIINSMAE